MIGLSLPGGMKVVSQDVPGDRIPDGERIVEVLIVGGTGLLGREVVREALAAGHTVRATSRTPKPDGTPVQWFEADLTTGKGLEEAAEGTDAVVFAAGDARNHAAVEVEGIRRLADRVRGHLVYVSIVGVDTLPIAYYRSKLAAEQALAASTVPHSILRATQFHPFVATVFAGLNRVPLVLPVPRNFRIQPVAVSDVAGRLVRCLKDGPGGLLRDFCGPEVFSLDEAARMWRDARRSRKPIIRIPVPGGTGAAFRKGYNTNPDGELGSGRWADWLAREYGKTE